LDAIAHASLLAEPILQWKPKMESQMLTAFSVALARLWEVKDPKQALKGYDRVVDTNRLFEELIQDYQDYRENLEDTDTNQANTRVALERAVENALSKLDDPQCEFIETHYGSKNILAGLLYESLTKSKCSKVPEKERRFRTKAQLALELVQEARAQGLRFGMICVDGGYGHQGKFLHQLDQRGENYVAEVHCDQRLDRSRSEPLLD
jgi:hypothetical protein